MGPASLLTLSAERAVYSVWALVSVGAGILLYSLIKGDFRMAYVWPPAITHADAVQGRGLVGRPGRLAALMVLAAVDLRSRHRISKSPQVPRHDALRGRVLMFTQTFFLILNAFVASPFKMIAAGRGIVDIGEWPGSESPASILDYGDHPPMLYLGYVGFIAPFAFAIASLATKQPGDEWIKTTRR